MYSRAPLAFFPPLDIIPDGEGATPGNRLRLHERNDRQLCFPVPAMKAAKPKPKGKARAKEEDPMGGTSPVKKEAAAPPVPAPELKKVKEVVVHRITAD